ELSPDQPPTKVSHETPRRGIRFTACVPCRESHSACDEGRPCQRCIKQNIGQQCRNPLPKKRGRPNNNNKPHSDAPKKRKILPSPMTTNPHVGHTADANGATILHLLSEIQKLKI